MARIVNVYHIAQFFLRSTTWLEWVPSAANMADLPSRLDYATYFQHVSSSEWVVSALPPPPVWRDGFRPLAACVERMLAA